MSHIAKCKKCRIRQDHRLILKTVADMQRRGVRCSLETNAEPRMFSQNQIKRQLKRDTNVCDFVIRLKNARHDVGFIAQPDGTLMPIFDDYTGEIRKAMGAPTVSKWKGPEASIGKFLQSYEQELLKEIVVQQNCSMDSIEIDAEGNIQMLVEAD